MTIRTLPDEVTATELIRDCFEYLNEMETQSIYPQHDHLCAYRGNDGNMCAVGVYIPEECYSDEYEAIQLHEILEADAGLRLPIWMHEHPKVLGALQAVHDGHTAELRRLRAENLLEKYDIHDIELRGPLFTA